MLRFQLKDSSCPRSLRGSHLLHFGFVLLLSLIVQLEAVHAQGAVAQGASSQAADSKKKEKPSTWSRRFDLGFNLTDGNSNTTLLTAGVKIDRSVPSKRDEWHFKANHSYGEEDSETNIDRSDAEASYRHVIDNEFFWGISENFERDDLAAVDYRTLTAVKGGYYFLRTERFRFRAEAGPGYLFEKVTEGSHDYLAAVASERFEWVISPTANLYEEVSIIASTEDSDNYLVNAEIGLEAAVTTAVSLIFKIKSDYDNEPAEGRKKNDLISTTSLAYTF